MLSKQRILGRTAVIYFHHVHFYLLNVRKIHVLNIKKHLTKIDNFSQNGVTAFGRRFAAAALARIATEPF